MTEIKDRNNSELLKPAEIRPMKEEDLGPLSQVYVDVYTTFDVGEKWDKESAEKMLGYWFKRHPDLAFVAEDSGKLVGAFLAGVKPWWDGNHLIDGEIFVHPKYQKRGIGSQLSKELFKKAKEKYDVTVWDTYTFKGFKHPLSWYKSLGFEEIGEWTMISGNIDKALKKLSE